MPSRQTCSALTACRPESGGGTTSIPAASRSERDSSAQSPAAKRGCGRARATRAMSVLAGRGPAAPTRVSSGSPGAVERGEHLPRLRVDQRQQRRARAPPPPRSAGRERLERRDGVQRRRPAPGQAARGGDADPQPGEGARPDADRDRSHVVPARAGPLQQPGERRQQLRRSARARPSSRSGVGRRACEPARPSARITHAVVDGHRGVEPDQVTVDARPAWPRTRRRSPSASILRRSPPMMREPAASAPPARGSSSRDAGAGPLDERDAIRREVVRQQRRVLAAQVSSRNRSTCETGTRPAYVLADRERGARDRSRHAQALAGARARRSSCPCRHRPRQHDVAGTQPRADAPRPRARSCGRRWSRASATLRA